ncbi:hypothetical protein NDU88_006215 [Pleurodeles waltl]|uniref:Uncharacterized protein n=1 Tax=Pleurodeles waltl TaxID=8319 RepID=A0AAV7WBV2_PLEWA|nr:hypothetical protein NDU88_006215 [Pleurodeles waltl]
MRCVAWSREGRLPESPRDTACSEGLVTGEHWRVLREHLLADNGASSNAPHPLRGSSALCRLCERQTEPCWAAVQQGWEKFTSIAALTPLARDDGRILKIITVPTNVHSLNSTNGRQGWGKKVMPRMHLLKMDDLRQPN